MTPKLPPQVERCDCGAKRDDVESHHDGISIRYTCGNCQSTLADLIMGAEP